jgi:fructokinase
MPEPEILCVGELLWDALPAGLFLGGAPFNVACHLRAAGLPVALVSRVGADRLGEEALRRVAGYGVAVDLVQVDPALPTGFVHADLDAAGQATFEIVAPAAWDAVAADAALLARARGARAVVFGSLAQRDPVGRRTVEALCDAAGAAGALLVFNANLRPPHDDPEVVRRSLARSAVVKVTEAELLRMADWFALPGGRAVAEGRPAGRTPRRPPPRPGARPRAAAADDDATVPTARTVAALAERFDCDTVCVTRGADGAGLWRGGRWSEHPGFQVEVRDLVGAGDAFLAVLLAGLLRGMDGPALLQHAALAGAYVATQSGAVPADQPALPTPPPATRDRKS